MTLPSVDSVPADGKKTGGLAVCFNSSYLGFCTHAGFLQGLGEIGVRPSHVSGASAGALVAGLHAAGLSPDRILDLLVDGGLMGTFFEWMFVVRGAALTLNRPGFTGLMSGGKTLAFLRRHLGDRRIEDCQDPRLALAVTNLTKARAEVVTEGPLAEFIVASCAFPVICAARKIGGQSYWDGGIANASPIDPWIEDPAIHTIVIHEVMKENELAACNTGRDLTVSGACGLSHHIICDELLRAKIRRAGEAGKKVIVLRTVTPPPGLFRRRPKIICAEKGRATAHEKAADLLF